MTTEKRLASPANLDLLYLPPPPPKNRWTSSHYNEFLTRKKTIPSNVFPHVYSYLKPLVHLTKPASSLKISLKILVVKTSTWPYYLSISFKLDRRWKFKDRGLWFRVQCCPLQFTKTCFWMMIYLVHWQLKVHISIIQIIWLASRCTELTAFYLHRRFTNTLKYLLLTNTYYK